MVWHVILCLWKQQTPNKLEFNKNASISGCVSICQTYIVGPFPLKGEKKKRNGEETNGEC